MSNSTEKIYGAIYDNRLDKLTELLSEETGTDGQYDDSCWVKLNAACKEYDDRYPTWLHFSCNPDEDRTEIVQLLLEKGAKPFLKDDEGSTPLDLACGNIVMGQYHMGVISALLAKMTDDDLKSNRCRILFSAMRDDNKEDLNDLLAKYDPEHSKQSNVTKNENGDTVIKYNGTTYVVGSSWNSVFPKWTTVQITDINGIITKCEINENKYHELCAKANGA